MHEILPVIKKEEMVKKKMLEDWVTALELKAV